MRRPPGIGGTVRSRLLLVVLSALLPVALFGIWQGWTAHQNARQLITDRLRANAWEVAETERDPFIIARHAMLFAAQQPAVNKMSGDCQAVLSGALRGADGVLNFVRTDAQGKARCSVLPFTPGQDLSDDPWWIESRGKSGIVVTAPQIGRISRRSVLIMVLPIYTAEGRFDGTLSAGISLERLAGSLAAKQRGTKGRVFLANREGALLLEAGRETFDRLPGIDRAQRSSVQVTARDGAEWTYVAAPLFAPDIHVIYAEPSRSVLRTQLQDTRFAILLQAMTLVIAGLAIWLGSQRLILRWLKQLHRLVDRFGRGDFTGERERYAEAPKEIAELADGLHDMAAALQDQEQKLREALIAETALTREVHHRVKNSLQIVSSLLTMQGDNQTDPATRAALAQARARIGALLLIHNLVYDEGTGGERGSVRTDILLDRLCVQLRAAFRTSANVTLECKASSAELGVDQAIPTALFTVEALTNAFNHGFNAGETGAVLVEFTDQDNQAALAITDDGSGFDVALQREHLGLNLMDAYAVQLGGSMESRSTANGSELILRFPIVAA